MTDRTRLLSSSAEPEISTTRDYGSIQSSSEGSQPEAMNDDSKTTLKFFEKIGFSLGHVYNDLCAAVWFSYTLLFMQGVLLMPGPQAGTMVMLGQVADALATPIVGYVSDKFSTKRKWHICGSFLVLMTFPLIFAMCPFCDILPSWWKYLYFSIIILVFQCGWPIVQITHLAMIPELSRTQRDRSDLTATRYSASICSNLVVYLITWAVLHVQTSSENKITPNDWPKFRDIALILTIIGVSMTVLFHFSLSLSGYEHRRRLTINQRNQTLPTNSSDTENLIRNQRVDEPSTSHQVDSDDDKMMKENEPTVVVKIPKKNFFASPLLYQNALLYVFSRLFMTTSLVYMPLWLNERSYIPAPPNGSMTITEVDEFTRNQTSIENIATVPLASFIASFISSNLFKQADQLIGHKLGYLLGSCISLCGCFLVAFAAKSTSSVFELYIVATFFGAGSSITMISSLCITANMIGSHADQGGFIYSVVTFCDKLITGCIIIVIETVKCKNRDECPTYYRNVLSIACGIPACCGIIILISVICTKSLTEQIEREERRRLTR